MAAAGTGRLAVRFSMVLIGVALLLPGVSVHAQDELPESLQAQAVKVFMDVPRQYEEYIKQEIPFVNYVRDRKQAEVHIMITTRQTGSGGTQHNITFTGLQNFMAIDDTLTIVSQQLDTEEEVRRSITNTLKLGLIRYVCETPLASNLTVSYRGGQTAPEEIVDKWDYWVFNIDTNTRVNGEESRQSIRLGGDISADRVTPDWKSSFSFGSNYNESTYDTGDDTITSITRSHDFRSLIVKSVSDHWSVGGYAQAEKSTFDNIELSYGIAPAIEYNVFPYEESTYHEFRFLYRVQYDNFDYVEQTIYFKDNEHLFSESLEATYEVKEQWGSVRTTLEGSHYFHDTSKNRVELNCNLNVRLFEGLSLDLFGSVSQIHDQLSLPGRGATEEEILTNQRALATSYDYSASIGLRYTFGSIYSNVVNPRFGNRRRGGGGGFRF